MSEPTTTPQTAPALPLRPRLVLRVGFAGRKELAPEEAARLETALTLEKKVSPQITQITQKEAV